MIAEAKISELTGIFSSADFQTVKQSLRAAELPVSISYVQIDDILQKMQADKKNENGEIKLTLLKSIGHAVVNQVVDEKIIKKGLEEIIV